VEIVGAYVVSGRFLSVRLIDRCRIRGYPAEDNDRDFPTEVYYEPTMPTGTLYPYPIPPSGTLHLLTRTPVSTFALTDTVTSASGMG
jgi:hypothetical protein